MFWENWTKLKPTRRSSILVPTCEAAAKTLGYRENIHSHDIKPSTTCGWEMNDIDQERAGLIPKTTMTINQRVLSILRNLDKLKRSTALCEFKVIL